MITLQQLFRAAETASVTINGIDVLMKELTVEDIAAVRGVHPRPLAPLAPDPERGSLAPGVPNERDQDHRAAVRDWSPKVHKAELAIAMEWKTADGAVYARGMEADKFKAWVETATKEIGELFDSDLGLVLTAFNKIGTKKAASEGNLSAPQKETAGQTQTPSQTTTS